MTEAKNYPIPISELDKMTAQLALRDAQRFVAEGMTPEEAANKACHGAWAIWRGWVAAILTGEQSILHAITNPEEAAAVTRVSYGSRARDEALRRAANATTEADKAFWMRVAEML